MGKITQLVTRSNDSIYFLARWKPLFELHMIELFPYWGRLVENRIWTFDLREIAQLIPVRRARLSRLLPDLRRKSLA